MSLEYVIYLLIYRLSLYDVNTSSYGHMASFGSMVNDEMDESWHYLKIPGRD
jgi:hypothetical protein